MKTIKITLTPQQRVQLAHAATLEIDLPDYDQVTAERDSAWRELRDIRNAINANPEESTLDEVVKLYSQKLNLLNAVDQFQSQSTHWFEMHESSRATLESIKAFLNPNDCSGLGLVELLQLRLTDASRDGFQAGFDASGEGFNGECGCHTDKSKQHLKELQGNWLTENGYKKAP